MTKTIAKELDRELQMRAVLVTGAIEELLPVVHPRPLYEAGRHLVLSLIHI